MKTKILFLIALVLLAVQGWASPNVLLETQLTESSDRNHITQNSNLDDDLDDDDFWRSLLESFLGEIIPPVLFNVSSTKFN